MSEKSARHLMLRQMLRQIPALLLGGLCLWLLTLRAEQMDLRAAAAAIRNLELIDWFWAGLATLVSFWAIGRYDAILHRHLRTGISDRAARFSGAAAIALSQTLGFGIFTGALARWRMLSSLSLGTALRLTIKVAAAFLLCWVTVVSLSGLILRPDLGVSVHWLWLGLGVPLLALWLSIRQPRVKGLAGGYFPAVTALLPLLFWTFVDTFAAGIAFAILLSTFIEIQLFQILPVFIIAFGVGLFSGMPGGIGAFEITLFALLPDVDPYALTSAILAFRLIYFAVPASIALLALIKPWKSQPNPIEPAWSSHSLKRSIEEAPRAESRLLVQNGGFALISKRTIIGCVQTNQCLVGLFDPLSGSFQAAAQNFQSEAKRRNRIACLYRVSARVAVAARRANLKVLLVANEALITSSQFNIDGPEHRTLRRKLRHAAKAGIIVTCPAQLPFEELAEVDRLWQKTHGRPRGFSMGIYSDEAVSDQKVLTAYHKGKLVAFVTFHQAISELTLDLMRHVEDVPDGTMHRLLVAAISDAKELGIPRVSLACVPATEQVYSSKAASWIAKYTSRRVGADGLIQFKRGFAPSWEPRYMAAPTWFGMAIALIDIGLAVFSSTAKMPSHTIQGKALSDADEVFRAQSQDHLEEFNIAARQLK